ncbi:MAG: bifunctional diguanylate cyclase/phosphodiesterase [Brevundimonas sp.]|nr:MULTISPECIES: EAL domain-containing protein [Brevundimonas]PZU58647.1 MAG: bifunctional diguanylate cyclase/phosphodiesterase [Brevundimonas sp.]
MFRVIECVWVQHDRLTVLMAAAIWAVGSLAFFLALAHARECGPQRRAGWLAIGGLAGGVGVWATHFVAMLAYDGGVAIDYDPFLTTLSASMAVAGFWLALRVLGDLRPIRCLGAAVVAVTAVAAMHFTGMAAMRVAAHIRYETGPIAAGGLIALALFAAAFLGFARFPGWRGVAIGSACAVLSVCTLHFTAMDATVLIPDPALPFVASGGARSWLIGATVGAAAVLIALTVTATLIDRHLTDLRGLAQATLEGLAILRDGVIVETNDRFAELVGRDPSRLIGVGADEVLAAADGLPMASAREKPVEAALRQDDADRIFEVASHLIEYRGRPSQVLAVRDLTETKAAQRRIEHLARHDGLTDLPNRTLFQERLEHALTRAARTEEALAVLALDLDRFKAVNDIFGHAEGDRVLKSVADILRRCVRASDTVARLGGDEFVVLQVGADQPQAAQALADRILAAFRTEMDPALDPTAVGVSVGVAVHPTDGRDAEALRHAADIALYRAKTSGRGQAAFFDARMDEEARLRRQLETDLRHAILRRQLRLDYQPLVRTADGELSGYEALLRWDHPERGAVGPDDFIPIAEETGAIITIGEWVLREACREAARWPDHLQVAVNVSPVQFQVATLADLVASALSESGLDPSRLELEITESALLKERASTVATLHRIKALGVSVVMDDFGTGYSSLSNLQSFPFDKIKIDRSFIASMEDDAAARSIVRAIVGIGRSLDLPIVAEGVETEAQRRLVLEEGCANAQGFFFGRPGRVALPRVLPGIRFG